MSNFDVTFTVDGVPLDDPAGRWALSARSRRRSLPAVRATRVSTPGRSGSFFTPNDTFEDSQFGLVLKVTDRDAQGVRGGAVQAEKNVELLTGLLTGTGRLMRVEHRIGPNDVRVAMCRVAAGSEPEPLDPLLETYLLRFVVEVPGVFWSDGRGAQLVEGAAPTASGTLALPVLEGGSAPVTDAMVRFAGPFNGKVSVSDVGGGAAYRWTGTPNGSTSTKTTASGTVTNLATNPSFESTSGTVEVWRCFTLNPDMTSHAFTGRITVSGPAPGYAVGTPAVSIPGYPGLTHVAEIAGTTGTTGGGYMRLNFAGSDITSVPVGTELTNTVLMWADKPGNYSAGFQTFDSAGAVKRDVLGTLVVTGGNEWLEIQTPFTVEEGEVRFTALARITAGVSTDVTLRAVASITNRPVGAPFWGGQLQVDPDMTARYVGTVGLSESVLEGQAVAGFSQATGTVLIKSNLNGKTAARQISLGTNMFNQSLSSGWVIPDTGTALVTAHILEDFPESYQAPYLRTQPPVTDATGPSNKAGTYPLRAFFVTDDSGTRRVQLRVVGAYPGMEVYWTDLMIVEGIYTGDYFDGSTPSTAGTNPTGLSYQGSVPAGTFVFLNADTLRAHTSTNPQAWDTGTDVSGNLDYPPAGPLQITPSAQTDGTHYTVAYTLPAAKNVPDAVAIRAERKFI